MAFIECRFNSIVLQKAVSMNVIIPTAQPEKPHQIMYLLHGLSDDASMWFRRSSIERYADAYNMMVVMPDGGRSFYTDAVAGENYWTFISEELPEIVEKLFNIAPARENTFAAGLSMGGYGALKLALRRPDRFAAAGALSAVTDIGDFLQRQIAAGNDREAFCYFGGDAVPADDDIFQLAVKTAALPPAERPRIFHACGTEDFLYTTNTAFRDHMQKLAAYDYSYTEAPGIHNWAFWDEHIRKVLDWLPLNG